MSEFVRLPSRIINLSAIASIELGSVYVILHYPNGNALCLTGDDAAELQNQLEERYGLMTAPAARLEDPIPT